MKERRFSLVSMVFGVFALLVFNPFAVQGGDVPPEESVVFVESAAAEGLTWEPQVDYAQIDLIVSGDDGIVLRKSFTSPDIPAVWVVGQDGLVLADGNYRYELRLATPLGQAEAGGDLGPLVLRQTGSFVVQSGSLSLEDEDMANARESAPRAINAGGNYFTGDGGFSADLCLGCSDGTNPSRELQISDTSQAMIRFDDTGTDVQVWDIGTSTSRDFVIRDVTNSVTEPFTIQRAAAANSIYVSGSGTGSVGLFTSVPEDGIELTVYAASGTVPDIRLESPASSSAAPGPIGPIGPIGKPAQNWDLRISSPFNDFQIYDDTADKVPFEIENGAGDRTLVVDSNSRVGIGTASPIAALDVRGHAAIEGVLVTNGASNWGAAPLTLGQILGNRAIVVTDMAASNPKNLYLGWDLTFDHVEIIALQEGVGYKNIILGPSGGNVGIGTTSPTYKLHVNGTAAGTSWTNLSSRDFKEDIRKVDETAHPMMLAKLMDMDLTTYKYKETYGGDGTTKLGFIAEDMPDEVLSKDGKGVDVYELLTLTIGAMKAQQRENEALKTKLVEMMARLEALEK
jgi:hypothetical protein